MLVLYILFLVFFSLDNRDLIDGFFFLFQGASTLVQAYTVRL